MAEEKVYSLYALRVTQESVETAMMERFSRIAPGYILIYTAGKQPKESLAINGEDLKRLSTADVDWIMSCAATLLRERLEKEKPEAMANLSRMVDQFAAALEVERKKLAGENKKGAEDHGDRDERAQ